MILKKRWLVVFLVFSFMLSAVSAEESANVLLTLKDITNNSDISSAVVTIKIKGTTITQFVGSGDILRANLPDGSYGAEFFVDDRLTDGKDFYGKDVLNVENSLIKGVYLHPVGSVRGMVKDSLGNVVGNAGLKFGCSGADIVNFPKSTDKFGSFFADYVPTGSCKILANYKDAVGFTNVIVEKGSLNDIEIKLDKSIIPPEQNYLWFIIITLIIILLVAAFFFREQIASLTKKEKKLEKTERKEEEEIKELKAELKLGKRGRDIMETLKEKEKEIVELIVREKGKTTQSKIYNETGIPKASLFRYIQSLERRKVIEIRKIGKVKKIKLTDWFLGKGDMKQSENVPQSSS